MAWARYSLPWTPLGNSVDHIFGFAKPGLLWPAPDIMPVVDFGGIGPILPSTIADHRIYGM